MGVKVKKLLKNRRLLTDRILWNKNKVNFILKLSILGLNKIKEKMNEKKEKLKNQPIPKPKEVK